jgi:hypothetical protein
VATGIFGGERRELFWVGDWVKLGEVGVGPGLGTICQVAGKDAANVTFT